MFEFYREVLRLIRRRRENPVYMYCLPWRGAWPRRSEAIALVAVAWTVLALFLLWMREYIAAVYTGAFDHGRQINPIAIAGVAPLLYPGLALAAILLPSLLVARYGWAPDDPARLEELQVTPREKREVAFGAFGGAAWMILLIMTPLFLAVFVIGVGDAVDAYVGYREYLQGMAMGFGWRPRMTPFETSWRVCRGWIILAFLVAWLAATSLYLFPRHRRRRFLLIPLSLLITAVYFLPALAVSELLLATNALIRRFRWEVETPIPVEVAVAFFLLVMCCFTALYVYQCGRFVGVEYFRPADPEEANRTYWRGEETLRPRRGSERRRALKELSDKLSVGFGVFRPLGGAVLVVSIVAAVLLALDHPGRVGAFHRWGDDMRGDYSAASRILLILTTNYGAMMVLFLALWIHVRSLAPKLEAEGELVVKGCLSRSVIAWMRPILVPLLAGVLVFDAVTLSIQEGPVSSVVEVGVLVFFKALLFCLLGMTLTAGLLAARGHGLGPHVFALGAGAFAFMAVWMFMLDSWTVRLTMMRLTGHGAFAPGHPEMYAFWLLLAFALFGFPMTMQRLFESLRT